MHTGEPHYATLNILSDFSSDKEGCPEIRVTLNSIDFLAHLSYRVTRRIYSYTDNVNSCFEDHMLD